MPYSYSRCLVWHGVVIGKGAAMKPVWLRQRLVPEHLSAAVQQTLQAYELNTVCEWARCPNRQQCYADGTATFLILGQVCSRNCRYCAIESGPLLPVDDTEPARVAAATQQLALRYVVITSVTRDDLSDGGATQFCCTIEQIRALDPTIGIEVLIPDFQGDSQALDQVLAARPDVINHNLETVERLYSTVRPDADYRRSLQLLRQAADSEAGLVKSGLMLGLGEKRHEIEQALHDLRNAGCQMLTLGQYLQPSRSHFPVQRYVTPAEFDNWRQLAMNLDFDAVASGPLVRSSWRAAESYRHCC